MEAKVITLRTREDRMAHVNDAAKSMGLNYSLHVVDRHPEGGVRGCFESHIEVIKNGARLIMEDDFEPTAEFFTPQGKEALKEVMDFVTQNHDWDLVYLGFMPDILFSSSQRTGARMYKIRSWACTQAYIISEPYAEKVSKWTWNGKAIDVRYRGARSFSVHPQLIKQYDSPSDLRIQGPSVPFLRDVPQTAASWWAMHVGVPLYHIGIAFGIFLILWIFSRSHSSIARNVLHRSIKT
jgi:hypothetical protein